MIYRRASFRMTEGAFIDLDLRLVRLESRPDGTFVVQGKGRRHGRVIGFALELNAQWDATLVGETEREGFFYWGAGTVRSVGVDSDALLAILASLYELQDPMGAMRSETPVLVVGLGDDPRRLAEHPTHMKLFFENENPERYAEVYVNVIAAEKRLELHEKDPEYRHPLLLALGEGAA